MDLEGEQDKALKQFLDARPKMVVVSFTLL